MSDNPRELTPMTAEEAALWRRRGVIFLVYVCFFLTVFSLASKSWIAVELAYSNAVPTGDFPQCPLLTLPAGSSPPVDGMATTRVDLHFSVTSGTQFTTANMPPTGDEVDTECSFTQGPYIAYINNAASYASNTSRGPGEIPIWGVASGPVSIDNSLRADFWLLLVTIATLFATRGAIGGTIHGDPTAATEPVSDSLLCLRASSFIGFVLLLTAVALLGASNTKTAICEAFQPATAVGFQPLSCGYGPGFSLAIAACVFMGVTLMIVCFVEPSCLGLGLKRPRPQPLIAHSGGPSTSTASYQAIGVAGDTGSDQT